MSACNYKANNEGNSHLQYEYVVDCAVDVLGLSETWLTPDIDSSSVFINDFNVVRADRNSRGGGVAFYVRNGIAFKILHSNITAVLEELWISVKVNQRKYCLAIVYRPPSANVLDCFHQLTESLTNLSLDNDYAIVMGDFNINVLVNDGRSEMLNCFLESFDLSQLVKEPTRITFNSQTAIDLLMVSSADIISGYEVVDVDGISDHLALIFYVDASEISNLCKLRFIMITSYSRGYPPRRCKRLTVCEFLHILESCTDPGQLTSTLVNISLASQVTCTFKLQGRGKEIVEMVSDIKAFIKKLEYWEQFLIDVDTRHLPVLSEKIPERPLEPYDSKYTLEIVSSLKDNFKNRFKDFNENALVAQFVVSPFMEIDIKQFATSVTQNLSVDVAATEMESESREETIQQYF
ncbi:unnamed protein product [Acanthoscelides obtectus]|uniref:Endonuclease/exonuclease/phosphatase domain-containing protein n=1 Tax=Acanthoscelides obtectus TaxID=200917 RepID=A0A9P0L664_ACAOB|nr:unnamed protein product [Acanthoscelides obtectus]CAK1630907.1 hypothetical protein AOBTE_LOCUS6631 [Acanthoscelides obtectus]